MLLQVDTQTQQIAQRCEQCGAVNRIALGSLIVTDTATTPVCPTVGCNTCESYRLTIPDYEVGIGTHPGSLVGTRFADTGGVVREHTHGYNLDPEIIRLRRLHRVLHAALVAQGRITAVNRTP